MGRRIRQLLSDFDQQKLVSNCGTHGRVNLSMLTYPLVYPLSQSCDDGRLCRRIIRVRTGFSSVCSVCQYALAVSYYTLSTRGQISGPLCLQYMSTHLETGSRLSISGFHG